MSEYSDAVLAEASLRAYWRLHDSSGSFADASGRGHTGAETGGGNAITRLQPGCIEDAPAESAIKFNGLGTAGGGSYIEVPDHADWDLTSMTLEVWVIYDGSNAGAFYLTQGHFYNWGIYEVAGASTWQFYCRRNNSGESGSSVRALTIARVDDGQWHHLVGTYDAATQLMSFYFDGALAAQTTHSEGLLQNAGVLRMGTWTSEDNETNAYQDETAVYAAALPLSTIRDHFCLAQASRCGRGWNVGMVAMP